MAGGVGEGAIPLSIGYAEILHQEQGVLFAQVLPPIMLGSLTAILLAGFLNWVGKRRPHLTGEGRLQPGVGEELVAGEEKAAASTVDASAIAAAGVTAIALYLLGTACFKLFGLPGPVAMLFFAVAVKLTRAVPPPLQLAGQVVYRFFSTAVTYPLLFAIGVSLTPWETLVAALTLAEYRGDRLDCRVGDSNRVLRRAAAGHVPDRCGDRDRLPQRPRRHWRRFRTVRCDAR